jgi:hypothetical protein
MEDAAVIKLYEPSPIPCLYVAPANNMVGRVPLIPGFLLQTKLRPFPTYSASAGIQASESRSAVLTQRLWMELDHGRRDGSSLILNENIGCDGAY